MEANRVFQKWKVFRHGVLDPDDEGVHRGMPGDFLSHFDSPALITAAASGIAHFAFSHPNRS